MELSGVHEKVNNTTGGTVKYFISVKQNEVILSQVRLKTDFVKILTLFCWKDMIETEIIKQKKKTTKVLSQTISVIIVKCVSRIQTIFIKKKNCIAPGFNHPIGQEKDGTKA